MAAVSSLDSELTVNEIVARFPETIPVFNSFGLDICCGGGVRVEEAARRDGLDAAEILSALRAIVSGSGTVTGAESERAVRAGDLVVYEVAEPHGMRAHEEQLVIAAVIVPRPLAR